jgi:hypothetical protein
MSITLTQANIELIDAHRGWYRCLECSHVWSPMLGRGGRRPRGWWRCPSGCNADR